MNRTDLPTASTFAPDAGRNRPLTRQAAGLAGALQGIRAVVAIGLVLALAACGGGGSDLPQAADSSNTPNTPTATTSTATTTSTTLVINTSADAARQSANAAPATAAPDRAPCGIADFEAQVIAQLNQIRAQARSCGAHGHHAAASPLAWHDALERAAAGHSVDMAQRGYFSHTSPEGQTMAQRVSAAGYAWTAVAENIAAGQVDISAALAAWVASDGHCANLMGAAYREVALSCARADNGMRYWTMNLARR